MAKVKYYSTNQYHTGNNFSEFLRKEYGSQIGEYRTQFYVCIKATSLKNAKQKIFDLVGRDILTSAYTTVNSVFSCEDLFLNTDIIIDLDGTQARRYIDLEKAHSEFISSPYGSKRIRKA